MEGAIKKAISVEDYIEVLDKKGPDAAKEYLQSYFGVEGTEEFKTEEFQEFSNRVVAHVIEHNVKMMEDEKTAKEAVEEEVKDEADA